MADEEEFQITDQETANTQVPVSEAAITESAVPAEVSQEPEEIYVDVSGAVVSPGVYCLDAGSRIFQAIEAAGGCTTEAAPVCLNQAAELSDGQKVYVPTVQEAEDVAAGNGAGGFYANMLEELGAWVEGSQFLEPDGHFPNHIPNPENADAMASISAAVRKYDADLGVIFDADCDRAAIVDHTGREINRNRLIALISAILLEEMPGATIVTDSVTSSGLADFIQEWGGVHYRYKRGYRNVIDEAIRLNEAGVNCPLAIETSGHAALRSNHFLDDGMYLVTVLLIKAMQLKQQGEELSKLLDGLKEPVESREIRLNVIAEDFAPAARQLIERLMEYATEHEEWHIAPDNREGVRISFDIDSHLNAAWFLLRLSVHDPVMPLNAESDVPGGVRYVLQKLYEAIQDETDVVDLSPLRAALQ